jgi:hypothetical protein
MTNVETADQATEILVNFLKEHYPNPTRPLKARKDDGKWFVELDVGAFFTRAAKVTIDATTGGKIEYDVPTVPLPPTLPRTPFEP